VRDDEESVITFRVVPTTALLLAVLCALMAVVALAIAIVNERRMQRHRQPGISYAAVTFRRDGAWRRADLFTDTGLAFQRRAAKWGMIGAGLLLLALIALTISRLT
jgi:hypothetical protein